jgi:hypothetical protein
MNREQKLKRLEIKRNVPSVSQEQPAAGTRSDQVGWMLRQRREGNGRLSSITLVIDVL